MIKIYFDGTYISDENYISFDYSKKMFDTEFYLGSTASINAKLSIPSVALPSSLSNVKITLNDVNYLDLYVDEITIEEDDTATVKLCDKLSFTDVEYDFKDLVPVSAKTLLENICTKFNIEHDVFNFTNKDVTISSYDSSLTAREYISMIAELAGGYAAIDNNGKLYIGTYNTTTHNLTTENIDTYKLGKKIKIERVFYQFVSDIKETSSNKDLYTIYLNSNNMFLQNLTDTQFTALTNNILNFEFYNVKINTSNLFYNNDTVINLIGLDETNYKILNQYEVSYAGGFIGSYETKINNNIEQQGAEVNYSSQNIKRLKQIIDQEANKITITAEKVEDITTPLKTVSGSNIYIQDATDTDVVELDIDGRSEQATRSGKNLVNLISGSGSGSGITAVWEKGIVTLNGTATANVFFSFNIDLLSKGTVVSISANNNEINGDVALRLRNPNTGSTGGTLSFTSVNRVRNNYAIENDYNQFQIRIASGAVLNNFVLKPQLELGPVSTEWELYGVSPSPDYPSEIDTVKGYNLFTPEELENKTATSFERDGEKVIVEQSSSAVYKYGIVYLRNLKKNTSYTFKANFSNSNADLTQLWLSITNNPFTTIFYNSTYTNGQKITFNTGDNDTIQIWLYGTGNKTAINTATWYNIQLVEGTIEKTYLPHQNIGIKIAGKNKLYLSDSTFSQNGITTNIKDGVVQINGTATRNYSALNGYVLNEIEAGTYTFSINKILPFHILVNLRYQDGTNENKTIYGGQTSVTFSTTKKITSYNLNISSIVSGTTYNEQIYTQLEAGTVATKYEPHKETIIPINIQDNELCSIDDVKDELIIKDNKVKLIKRIGKVILNGTENWRIPGSNDSNIVYANLLNTSIFNYKSDLDKQYSNHFLWGGRTGGWATALDKGVGLYTFLENNNHYCYFVIPKTIASTADNFKTWLSNNNVTVYYILNEPEEINLVDDISLKLYKGINDINLLATLETNMTLTYVRDTAINSYVEGQLLSERTIRQEKIATLEITDSEIKSDVFQAKNDIININKTYDGLSQRIDANKATLEKQEKSFDSDGNVIAVKVKEGISFDESGLQIYSDENQFKTHINERGTVYMDGNNIVGQYTKDGSKQKDLELFGVYRYGKKEINDSAMFVAQLYTNENNEEGFGHFYNGGNL